MGRFQGVVLPVSELLARSLDVSHVEDRGLSVGLEVSLFASDAATTCRELLARGEGLLDCWRFGLMQTLDWYESYRRLGGPGFAAKVFTLEPQPTGSVEVDAAFAALAAHLAQRDGWVPPNWTSDPKRVLKEPWFVDPSPVFHEDATNQSPPQFRSRGIHVTANDLTRA